MRTAWWEAFLGLEGVDEDLVRCADCGVVGSTAGAEASGVVGVDWSTEQRDDGRIGVAVNDGGRVVLDEAPLSVSGRIGAVSEEAEDGKETGKTSGSFCTPGTGMKATVGFTEAADDASVVGR